MLVREYVQGLVCFMSPLSLNFITHVVLLVPFGQLGENFWGVGHAVNICMSKIQNFIVNIYQNFIDCS